MLIESIDVQFEKRPNGTLSARVVQQDADGPVFGRELLPRTMKDLTRARKIALREISCNVLRVRFIFSPNMLRDPETTYVSNRSAA